LQDGPSYFGFNKINAPSNPLLPYNYSNSWDRQERKNTLNNNISLSAGKIQCRRKQHYQCFSYNWLMLKTDTTRIYRTTITAQGAANTDLFRKSYQFNTNSTVMGRCCVYQTKLYIVYYFIPVYFTRLQRV
jgi:hypothetical protein